MRALKETWYMAGWDSEITEEPGERVILEQSLVVYRKSNGEPVVMDNRCPHRFSPLSKGRVVNDNIQCPYHGLEFNHLGACVANPHPNGCGPIPEGMQIKSYPLIERFGGVWVWMGESDPDESLLPDYGYISDEDNYRTIRGTFEIDSHYELVADNALDLTHVTFVHDGGLGGGVENVKNEKKELVKEGATLWCKRYNDSIVAGPDFQNFNPLLSTVRVDKQQNVRWDPPCSILIVIKYTKAGEPDTYKTSIFAGNILTPISETKTKFYWSVSRDFNLDSAELDAAMQASAELALIRQDKPMIESQLELMGTVDLDKAEPVYIQDDAMPIRARKILNSMIEETVQ